MIKKFLILTLACIFFADHASGDDKLFGDFLFDENQLQPTEIFPFANKPLSNNCDRNDSAINFYFYKDDKLFNVLMSWSVTKIREYDNLPGKYREYDNYPIEKTEVIKQDVIKITTTNGVESIYNFDKNRLKLIDRRTVDGKRIYMEKGINSSTNKPTTDLVICDNKSVVGQASKQLLNSINLDAPEKIFLAKKTPELLSTQKAKEKLEFYATQAIEETKSGNFSDACESADLVYLYSVYLDYERSDQQKFSYAREELCKLSAQVSAEKLKALKKPYEVICNQYKIARNHCATAANTEQCMSQMFPNDSLRFLCESF